MVAAVDVTVAAVDDISAGNLQDTLGTIYGKAQYAANAAGEAKGTADWAAQKVGEVEGTAQYAADMAGFLDYHVRQIANQVGYTMPQPAAAQADQPDPAE